MTERRAWVIDMGDWSVPVLPEGDAEFAFWVECWDALHAPPRTPRPAPARAFDTAALLRLHQHLRSACAAPAPPVPARARHAGGRPTNRARNDRLLALYEGYPERLHKLQRCRLVAKAYKHEIEDMTGVHEREMPAATVRDAVAEARRRRDQGA